MGMLRERKERGPIVGTPSHPFIDKVVKWKKTPDPKTQKAIKRELKKGLRWFVKEAKTL